MASTNPASGRFDQPYTGFAPETTVLAEVTPEEAGLDPAPLRAAGDQLRAWTGSEAVEGHPLFAGAVGTLVHNGMVVDTVTAGSAVRYADGSGTELPANEQVPMRADTIFDMASVTKLFTSIAVLQLVEDGKVDLDAPVAEYLPEFAAQGKGSITVTQLLTHTSGLEPELPLWRDWPDKAARIKAVMDVRPQNRPGTTYTYSDLNLITLGVLVERVSGTGLDEAVSRRITGPLGMTDTGFNPPEAKLDRIAATEYQADPPRGMVRGQVHDENAWSLGGVSGHAGIFSTSGDMAVLGQSLLNGGAYAGKRILREDTVRTMLTNYNTRFPGDDHGLGFELNQLWYMGGLSSPTTAGHTGYTGTSIVLDPQSRSVVVLLTNRVHPSRSWGSINPARQAYATGLARAMAVRPAKGPRAWFSGIGDSRTATLTTPPLAHTGGDLSVDFATFVNSEPTDPLVLEASSDGHRWQPVELRVRGEGAPEGPVTALAGTGHRSWWNVHASVPATGNVTLRWRFTTDGSNTARGNYVDAVRVTADKRVLLDGERQPYAFAGDGFRLLGR
ncbi:CubicO group peptidase, beta-lactamase class C family [Prauserella marina]|uniref:CubicO group peptidase, beta-lactamase class C family n=1 Tax=Prauserella marina TaxID=530584 RepID=A0A1G6PX70_9PSEU|nr:serine hydrolase domain-containing protein [Prauserella marina]PWV78380.1 CubicO group peptidase (beta-lactamase class C family) [Prauserella marina]SDC84723.1 CubicO group peptidase, beta-lactamase class C family [Prauserella marina]